MLYDFVCWQTIHRIKGRNSNVIGNLFTTKGVSQLRLSRYSRNTFNLYTIQLMCECARMRLNVFVTDCPRIFHPAKLSNAIIFSAYRRFSTNTQRTCDCSTNTSNGTASSHRSYPNELKPVFSSAIGRVLDTAPFSSTATMAPARAVSSLTSTRMSPSGWKTVEFIE